MSLVLHLCYAALGFVVGMDVLSKVVLRRFTGRRELPFLGVFGLGLGLGALIAIVTLVLL